MQAMNASLAAQAAARPAVAPMRAALSSEVALSLESDEASEDELPLSAAMRNAGGRQPQRRRRRLQDSDDFS